MIITQMATTPSGAVALQSSGKLKNGIIMNTYLLWPCILEKDSENDVKKDQPQGITLHY